MKLTKKEFKEMMAMGLAITTIAVAIIAVFSTLTAKTAITAIKLFSASSSVEYAEEQRDEFAPEGVHSYADEVYENSLNSRNELYNSEDGYVRWFSYTMGQTTLRRLVSLLVWAIEFALTAIGIAVLIWSLKRSYVITRCYYRCNKKKQRAR